MKIVIGVVEGVSVSGGERVRWVFCMWWWINGYWWFWVVQATGVLAVMVVCDDCIRPKTKFALTAPFPPSPSRAYLCSSSFSSRARPSPFPPPPLAFAAAAAELLSVPHCRSPPPSKTTRDAHPSTTTQIQSLTSY
ncbi:hypothetical protein Droror1_Dr00016073 [Drosera rotundifolia]